jgi:hypothetical protein
MSLTRVKRKYEQFYNVEKQKLVGVEIPRENKKPLIAVFGRKPIQRQKGTVIKDIIQTIYINRNGLIDRLLAEVCEVCGKEGSPVQGHHIRKLKDLKRRWRGKEKPVWVRRMIEMRRKSSPYLFASKSINRLS